MKINWLGHSCFLITSDKGTKIITDPFRADSHLSYPQVKENADIVTVSHEHLDHNFVSSIQGKPEIVKGSTTKTVKNAVIKGISVWHDDTKGMQRGANTIFCIYIDGINICHLGDLGHILTENERGEIGQVDVLLIPIGGLFTIDIEMATEICEHIKPRIVIPMHYKTDRCQWLKWSADDFVKGKRNYKKLDSSEIEFTKDSLPTETEIIMLKYAV